MKVLMLGWELPPHNSGGLGVACYQMCKALSKKGIDIEFIVPYTSPHPDIDFMKVTPALPATAGQILKSGIAYDSFKYLKPGQALDNAEDVDLFTQVERYAQNIEYVTELDSFDIIHAHDWLTFRAALRLKELTGKPLVAHFHATEFDRAGGDNGNPFVHEIEYMCLLLADRVVAVSQFTKDLLVKGYGIPEDKIQVVHNSIEPGDVVSLADFNEYVYLDVMRKNGYRVVSNIGRLTIQKGITNLLLAAKEVIFRSPKTLFLIVGSGDQYQELLQLSADLGIAKNVIFTDFQRGKRLRDAFAIADLFVLPSVSEPFGLTPLEAIGYGTPALVSKQSGISEVITNCLKVDFWDINEMANQITAVVQNDSLRDELHYQSYKEYLNMSWNGAADKLMDTYEYHHKIALGTAV